MGRRSALFLVLVVSGLLAFTVAPAVAVVHQDAAASGSDSDDPAVVTAQLGVNTQDPAFAGEAYNHSTNLVDLWSTDTSDATIDRMIAGQDRNLFTVHQAKFSLNQLFSAQQDLIAKAMHVSPAFNIVRTYPDFYANRLMIRISGDLKSAQSYFASHYAGSATATSSTPDDQPEPYSDRLHDVAPFYGGDFITESSGTSISDCTSGPGIHVASTGNDYLLTDAHCFTSASTGQAVRNSYYDGTSELGSKTSMGTITHTKWPASAPNVSYIDSALISPSSVGGFDWGLNNTPRQATGFASQASQVGLHFCASGAYEDEVCPVSATVQTIGNTFADSRNNIVTDATYTNAAGGIVIGAGDSGGPVWHAGATSTVTLFGTIWGGTAPFVSCVTYTWRGANCSKTLVYTDMSRLLVTWGATLR